MHNAWAMSDESERLIRARQAHGRYRTATEAARALGIPPPTYLAHENGSRGFSKEDAARYARFYRVSVEWLYRGYGPQKPGGQHPLLETYEELPPTEQRELIDFAEFLKSRRRAG